MLPDSPQAQVLCDPPDARLVSIQGTVELKRVGTDVWTAAMLEEAFCIGDTLRVGTASRAALALANDSTLRLDERTTLQLRGVAEEPRSLIDLILGGVYFFSHRSRALEVDTPFVNAAAEGTEFLVRVGAERAEVVMLDGRVLLRNPQGELRVASGDAALIPAGQAPQPMVVARPRDAVAWALYYPPILTALAGRGAVPPGLPPGLQAAIDAVAANDYAGALDALDAVPEAARDARYWTYRAGVLLNVGRVDEAGAAIERALALDPEAGDALAQRAIIQVVQNRNQEALADASRAVELSPDSAAAAIALSYALQAAFQLEEAREVLRTAVERTPEDALAWARLAELEQMFGELGRSRDAAERAVALAPELARTQIVLGFAALTRIDIDQAKVSFERAIALDSANPLPRLGLGLGIIRTGDLDAGGRQIEIAAALDPDDSLIRSYLGKTYFEEKRGPLDAEQFAIAKQLDPNDPTPWFYDAIRLQTVNRPIDALHNIQRSIELNDNRAVYRSRLLLDQDIASRSARLGRIYNDLGFQQLALVEGWKSINIDPANFSAHRLLADTYSILPNHDIARNSELLQSQLLQPLNINPVQPVLADTRLDFLLDTGPADVGFNEFTRLFTRNEPIRFVGDFLGGTDNTLVDNVILSGLYNRFSYSFGQFHFETDGTRPNNDFNQNTFNAFGQWQFRPGTVFLTELRHEDIDAGDIDLLFDPSNFVPNRRQDVTIESARIGFRHDLTPSLTLLGTYFHNDLEVHDDIPEVDQFLRFGEDFDQLEFRTIKRNALFNADFGASLLRGNLDIKNSPTTSPEERLKGDTSIYNGYLYGSYNGIKHVSLRLGLSADYLDDPTLRTRNQLNPKFGLMWQIAKNAILRGAVFRTLERPTSFRRTIEPTEFAGFNQFFDDFVGTDSWRYGVGLDYVISPNMSAGAEYSQRDLDIPLGSGEDVGKVDADEKFARAYFYWTPTARLATGLEYRFEHLEEDPQVNKRSVRDLNTHSVPLNISYFWPMGLFAQLGVTYVHQEGDFIGLLDQEIREDHDDFVVADASLGYRLPRRLGVATIQANNLFDQDFHFQDLELGAVGFSRGRSLFARLTLTF